MLPVASLPPVDMAGICVCTDTPDFADYFSNSNKNYTLNGVKYDFKNGSWDCNKSLQSLTWEYSAVSAVVF